MQKSKFVTIGIILIMAIYAIFSSVYLITQHNINYLYVINPVFYIIISIFIKFTFGKNFEKTKFKKDIFTCSAIATLVYIITYILSGLFVTFGKNPYSTNLNGVLTNMWILGSVTILKEYIRYKLINNVYEKDKVKIAILISAVYIFVDAELYRHFITSMTALSFIKYLSQTLIPLIIKNILYSCIDMNTGIKPVLVYELLTKLYMWTSPILPNSPWIMNAMIEIVIPMMFYLYILYIKSKKTQFYVKDKLVDNDPKSYIPFIICVILVILFSLGIFSIQPVAIATGSMEKELFIGDVAVIKKCNANDVIEGDIIQYQMDGYTVIHRVKEKHQKQGDIYFITKGDNNRQEDALPVTEQQLIGKVIFKIKYIGYPAIWLNFVQNEEQVEVETGNL